MDILSIVLACIVVALILIIVWILGKEKQARLSLRATRTTLAQMMEALDRKTVEHAESEKALEAMRPDALLGRQAREQRAAASRKAVEKAAERRAAKTSQVPPVEVPAVKVPAIKPKPASRKRKLAK